MLRRTIELHEEYIWRSLLDSGSGKRLILTDHIPQNRPINWAAHRGAQDAFLSCQVQEVLAEGERGGGKTDCLIMGFTKYCGPEYGFGRAWTGILFAHTYKQLDDVLAKVEKTILPSLGEHRVTLVHGQKPEMRFKTGERLLFRHMAHERDYWNYHGHEYPYIAWEELTRWADAVCYKRMFSCNRVTLKGTLKRKQVRVPLLIRSSTNPYGPGHNWVKSRFELPRSRNTVLRGRIDDNGFPEPERVAIYFPLSENKALMEQVPEYKANIAAAASNPAEMAAWMEGDWDIVAGGMFDDIWSECSKCIIKEPFHLPDTWRLDRSFDWGSAKPFSVGWWAESDGSDYVDAAGNVRSTVRGDLFRIAEWYGWNGQPNTGSRLVPEQVAKGIIERELKWGLYGRVKNGVADSGIFNSEIRDITVAKLMAQAVRIRGRSYPGIRWNTCTKSRVPGWLALRTLLKNAKPPESLVRENRGMFVFNTCTHFLRTVPTLPRDEHDPDDADSNAEDHIADEVRYRAVSARRVIRTGRTKGDF